MLDLEKAVSLLEVLIKELKILNEHLGDLKEMIAPYLGFRVVKDKEEKE